MASKQAAILIIAPAWVGDMVMAQSLFKLLKRERPEVFIDVVAPQWSAGLLKHMPEVRKIIPHQIGHGQWAWQQRYEIGTDLKSENYQQAIVLPNAWKAALIPYWAEIPQRTGFLGEWRLGLLNDIRKKNKLVLLRTVDQFVALGLDPQDKRLGQLYPPRPQLSTGQLSRSLSQLNLNLPQIPVLALCPGAEYGEAKRWPLEYYAIVAKQKIMQGWQVWLFGSAKETSICSRIEALAGVHGRCFNLCGQTTLSDAINLISLATVVISNDSGLMHVAAALDKPLIAIYGSSNPGMTPPLNTHSKIVFLGLKCSPCMQRSCRYGHFKCLREIKPEHILTLINSTYLMKI